MKDTSTLINNSIFYLLVCYIFTINLDIKQITDTLFFLLTITSCLSIYYKKNTLKPIPKWVPIVTGIFILSFIIASFASPDIAEAFKRIRRLIKYILPAFMIFYFINDKKKIQILFITLFSSIFIEIIYALIISSPNFYNIIFNNISYRMQGYPPEPGKWPTFMLLSMELQIFFVSIYILLLDKNIKFKYKKLILSILLISCILAIFFNNTRMAWLIISFMFILITCCYIKNLKRLIIILGITFSLFGIIVYNQPWIQTRINHAIHFQDGSSQLHYMFVQDALVMIKDKPIFGWGLGQFGKYYNESYRSEKTNYLIKKYNEHLPVPYAHNVYVDTAVDTGFTGLIGFLTCYIGFLFFSFRDWYKYKSTAGFIFFSIILCFMLHGFSEKTLDFTVILKYHYCLLGMYLVYRKYEINKLKER